jgi:hypothetical protein
MSNNATTTFKLQALGTPSAFDFGYVNKSGFQQDEGPAFPTFFELSTVRASGPIFTVNDAQRAYMFAVKYDTVNETVVKQVVFELRNLIVTGDDPKTLKASLAFYKKTAGGNNCTSTQFEIIGNVQELVLDSSTQVNGGKYMAVGLEEFVTLPKAEVDTSNNPIPIYLGFKLKNANQDSITFNGESNFSSSCFAACDFSSQPFADNLKTLYSGTANALSSNPTIYLL